MTKSITLNIEQRENFLQLHNKLQRAVRYMEECIRCRGNGTACLCIAYRLEVFTKKGKGE